MVANSFPTGSVNSPLSPSDDGDSAWSSYVPFSSSPRNLAKLMVSFREKSSAKLLATGRAPEPGLTCNLETSMRSRRRTSEPYSNGTLEPVFLSEARILILAAAMSSRSVSIKWWHEMASNLERISFNILMLMFLWYNIELNMSSRFPRIITTKLRTGRHCLVLDSRSLQMLISSRWFSSLTIDSSW
ncbi:hypothetical protein OGATHE_006598 [Ogataea polymorpha]|uniref:Uncharacterized protein n=1 Tax=Ogataea polymorpha TaxID=460523 RepID=A0A9P8NTG6_9ASCO|nr:hypothetical protein OGATHE_006598 [Ogataea polymorpha]